MATQSGHLPSHSGVLARTHGENISQFGWGSLDNAALSRQVHAVSDTPRPSALTSLLTNAISAQQRADAIYDQPDPQAAFAALEIPQVFELLSEVGLQGSLELVELATPEQIQGCLDLAILEGGKTGVEDT